MTVMLNAESNLGYAADQIETRMTLADLREAVEAAVEEYGEDHTVVLYQTNNGYGANYGCLSSWQLFTSTDEADEDDQ